MTSDYRRLPSQWHLLAAPTSKAAGQSDVLCSENVHVLKHATGLQWLLPSVTARDGRQLLDGCPTHGQPCWNCILSGGRFCKAFRESVEQN